MNRENDYNHDTRTYFRAFGTGDVTTCFYELGLSRLGFEHPIFILRGERSNPLRHRRSPRLCTQGPEIV